VSNASQVHHAFNFLVSLSVGVCEPNSHMHELLAELFDSQLTIFAGRICYLVEIYFVAKCYYYYIAVKSTCKSHTQ
jgi:hypothetical protein